MGVMKFNRDQLLADLKLHTCKVHFTKVDGTSRIMMCTLLPEYLPPNTDMNHLDEAHRKPENLDVIVAWDLEKGGWRSFRVESVDYAEIVDGF
jgi:hypothetical protein